MSNLPIKEEHKCIFYDKIGSNNAARIRLWLRLQGLENDNRFEIRWIHSLNDMHTEEYTRVNPLRKSPAFLTETGMPLFEAQIILDYLHDKYYDPTTNPNMISMRMESPEDRAFVNLLVRVHDLYIASPNCNQPNFSHTQGCMYLSPYETPHCPARRVMVIHVRAAKLAEIHQQLTWLEEQIKLPYLASTDRITHADLTWFPTAVFFEFYLPKVFDWSPIFTDSGNTELEKATDVAFPKLNQWYHNCRNYSNHFEKVREEIIGELCRKEKGEIDPIRDEVKKHPEYKWKYT